VSRSKSLSFYAQFQWFLKVLKENVGNQNGLSNWQKRNRSTNARGWRIMKRKRKCANTQCVQCKNNWRVNFKFAEKVFGRKNFVFVKQSLQSIVLIPQNFTFLKSSVLLIFLCIFRIYSFSVLKNFKPNNYSLCVLDFLCSRNFHWLFQI
jgi:hypothetical protein